MGEVCVSNCTVIFGKMSNKTEAFSVYTILYKRAKSIFLLFVCMCVFVKFYMECILGRNRNYFNIIFVSLRWCHSIIFFKKRSIRENIVQKISNLICLLGQRTATMTPASIFHSGIVIYLLKICTKNRF